MNQKGAIPIIISLFMLSGVIAISLSVATVQIDRVQLSQNDLSVSITEQSARAQGEAIILFLDKSDFDISILYEEGGDGSGWRTDCEANDWVRVDDAEFCLKKIDSVNFEVHLKIDGLNIVRSTSIQVPPSCVPKNFVNGYGTSGCKNIVTQSWDIGIDGAYFSIKYCAPPNWMGKNYFYNQSYVGVDKCTPFDCRPDNSTIGPLIEIKTNLGTTPGNKTLQYEWRYYQCGTNYTIDNSLYSGTTCNQCPFGYKSEDITGHPVVPDGTYRYCKIPTHFRDARYLNSDVYAQSFEGPVCYSSVSHNYQGTFGVGTPFCGKNCNVTWSMWDAKIARTGQWTMHPAKYFSFDNEPRTSLCTEISDFDPEETYGIAFKGKNKGQHNAESLNCEVGTQSCRAGNATCLNGVCEELRFSCVLNVERTIFTPLRWTKYYDTSCTSNSTCSLEYCNFWFGQSENKSCGMKSENYTCFNGFDAFYNRAILLRCTREKNGWTIEKLGESFISNPTPQRVSGGELLWNKNVCGGFTDQEWGYSDINAKGELLPGTCSAGFSCFDMIGDFENGDPTKLVNVDCRGNSPCTDDRPVYNRPYDECCPIGIDPAYVGLTDPSERPETNCVSVKDLPHVSVWPQ